MGSLQSRDLTQDFIFHCQNGNFEMVKRIWNISNDIKRQININVKNDTPFKVSCIFGNSEIAKWLWDLSLEIKSPINIHVDNEYIFVIACQNGQLEIAKWLWLLSVNNSTPINITAREHEAFRMSCVCNQYDVASWLCELNPDYNFTIDSNGFIRPKIYNVFEKLMKNKNDINQLKLHVKNWAQIDKNKYCLICHETNDIVIDLKCQENISDHCYCIDCFCHWYSKNPPKCIVCTKNFYKKI
jgi:hypothetical protein